MLLVVVESLVFIAGAVFLILALPNEKGDSNDKFNKPLFATGISLVLLGIMFCIASNVFEEKVLLDESTEQCEQYQLAQITANNHSYFLRQQGDEFKYLYINDDEANLSSCPIRQAIVRYDDSSPRLTITETTQTYRRQWLIFHEFDRTETSYQYEFHLPNRDAIQFTFEK